MKTAAIIVAAGRGLRAGGTRPKQWRRVAGKPVARWSLEAFAHLPEIVLVIHPDDAEAAAGATRGLAVRIVEGGADRAASVRAGLAALRQAAPDAVLIHDVARPCIDRATIDAVCAALRETPGAAPALPVSDALWTGAAGRVTGLRDRGGLFRAQTPQGFRYADILAAHDARQGAAADDVAVALAAGIVVTIVDGSERNIKITGPEDFTRAAALLETRMDIRLGNGFDVHRFAPAGDHVMLCGVAVPHDRGLLGHSDADVGLHAVTDALYGALAEGDIGTHFPPSDPQWNGAQSHVFLRHAAEMARSRGYGIGNVDLTLICERPKIGPHAAALRASLADILGVAADRVSVKATTSERLGFTGREEGIAALATATLVRP